MLFGTGLLSRGLCLWEHGQSIDRQNHQIGLLTLNLTQEEYEPVIVIQLAIVTILQQKTHL